MHSFLKEASVQLASAAVSAGTTDVTSGKIDMQGNGGFDAIAFVMTLGDVADTSVITMTAYESASSDGSSPTAITGATCTFTAGASTADSKTMIVDICRKTKRYVFVVVTRATANAPVALITAVQYKGKNLPITQDSQVISSALAV